MKWRLLLLVLIAEVRFACAQNIVLNPSFECGPDPCDRTMDRNFINICNWASASYTTPDVFSTSVTGSCFAGQPNTQTIGQQQPGSQMPHSGKRFAGIFTFGNTSGVPPQYREYLSTALDQPLVVGAYYLASMYVALSPRMNYAANNLAMCFSVGLPTGIGLTEALNNIHPQIVHSEIITSTNWTKICGIFQATEAATMLTIGNFSDDSHTNVSMVNSNTSIDAYYSNSYYFIDDVSVEQLSNPNTVEVVVSGNEVVCLGESTSLYVNKSFDQVTWTNIDAPSTILSNDSTLTITPAASASYQVRVEDCGISGHDTVAVHVNPKPVVRLPGDTTICVGNILTLYGSNDGTSYVWQDGSTNDKFIVTSSGSYSVSVTNQYSCTTEATSVVYYLSEPVVELGKDAFDCDGIVILHATNPQSVYTWNNGSSDSVLTTTCAGKYWVEVKNFCGSVSDTIRVYSWRGIFFPNVVTLNEDDTNEKFRVVGLNADFSPSVAIYDRWGKAIFDANNYQGSWPQDSELPSGVYYFILTYPGCEEKYKGWVQVIR
jgi:gliding motility-associated-like protein